MTKNPSRRPGVVLDTMVAIVPMAALETMMQTPRPPWRLPHRPMPGDRRALRRDRAPSRPRESRAPGAPRASPSRLPLG
ncbi:MAG TPA: hypothetical protein VFW50_37500 [Streptosporangiaceae bacterium]|nr:hypothetical protein [Streptosporangiaceae bacterium]